MACWKRKEKILFLFKFKLPVTPQIQGGKKELKEVFVRRRDKQCKTCPEIWMWPVSSPLLPVEKRKCKGEIYVFRFGHRLDFWSLLECCLLRFEL